MKRIIFGIMLMLILIGVLTLISNIRPVESDSEVLFLDDFDDGVADGWTVNLGNFEVINGEYYTENDLGEKSVTTVDDLVFTDCIIEVSLRFSDTEVGFRSGIVFRYIDDEHYYVLYVSAETPAAEFCMFSPGDTHWGATIDGVINRSVVVNYNTNYLLKVYIQGDTFTGFLNGEKILQVTDGNYTSGQVGLRAQRSDIFFDNFIVISVPKTITVPDDYPTIQEAINAASEGDTIFVKNGTYYENAVVNKTVSLIGENALHTILDGEGNSLLILSIVKSNVTISNLTVKNTKSDREAYGIMVKDSENVSLKNVIATESYIGIILQNSSFCKLIDNAIVSNHAYGIYLRGGSANNTFTGNLLSHNMIGMHIDLECQYNLFHHNSFIENENHLELFIISGKWDNGCEGNYWSNYNGSDLDNDGIGDTDLPWEEVDYYPLMNPYWNPGDVDHDLDVDLYDAVRLLVAYGSEMEDEHYNCHCDITEPYGVIDLYDAVLLLVNYGKKYS